MGLGDISGLSSALFFILRRLGDALLMQRDLSCRCEGHTKVVSSVTQG